MKRSGIVAILLLASLLLFPMPAAWGQGWDWATYANSAGTDRGACISTDLVTAEVYVVGANQGVLSELGIAFGGGSDGFLAKYKANGTLIWAIPLTGTANEEGYSVQVDSKTHRVYLTGFVSGTVNITGRGGTPFNATTAGGADMLLLAVDSAGSILWGDLEGGVGDEVGVAITEDNANIYVTGTFTTNTSFNGATAVGPTTLAATGSANFFVNKYRKSDGQLQWAVCNIQGSSTQRATAITADSNGVYVCGNFNSPSLHMAAPVGNVVMNQIGVFLIDIFVVSLQRNDGLARWGTVAGAFLGVDEAFGIVSNGTDLYVSGRITPNAVFPPLGPLSTGSNVDGFLAKLNPGTGQSVWINVMGAIGGNAVESGFDVDIDPLGQPWLTGNFSTELNLPNNTSPDTTLIASGNNDLFLACFLSNGNLDFVYQAGGGGSDNSRSVSVYNHYNAYITGVYSSFNSQFATPTPTTLPLQGSEDILVAKYSLCNAHPNRSLAVTINDADVCVGDVVQLTVAGSTPGTTYTLIDSASGAPIGLSQVGTGGNLVFSTGALSGTVTLAVTAYVTFPQCAERLITTRRVTVHARPTVSLGADRTVCPGVAANLNAGNGFTTYAWSTGAATATIAPTTAGSYRVTVTDAWGCTAADTVLVSNYLVPVINLGPNINQCGGFGPALNAGPGFASYLWSTFQPSQSITATSSGLYWVQGTTANGCTTRDSIVVNLFALPTPNLGPDFTACTNGSVALNPGGGYASYAWSTGSSAPTIAVSTSATYTVTVTDGNGCQNSDAVAVNVRPLPTPSLGPDTTYCAGTTVAVGPSTGYSSYSWSNGATTSTISPTSSGTYTVTVTDAFGCQGIDAINVNVKNSPSPVLRADTSLCPGSSIALSTSIGYPGYAWSNGATTSSITVSTPATYQVTVTAGNGCTGTDQVVIGQYAQPNPALGNDTTICAGQSLTLAPGVWNSYSWSTGATTSTVSVNAAGSYTVTVTSPQGCQGQDQIVVAVSANPVAGLLSDSTTCPGTPVSLSAVGGMSSYAWSSGQSTQGITVINPGTYAVTVANNFGCTGTASMTLTNHPQPSVSVGVDQNICAGSGATVNATGGFASYLWNNGESTSSIIVATGGQYQVTVTDANGCQDADTMRVNVNPLPFVSLGADTSVCAGQTIVLNAGAGMSAYAWSSGQTTQSIAVGSANTYQVTVTDVNGCQNSDIVVVATRPSPSVNLGADTSICSGATLALSAPASMNAYVWSSGAVTQGVTVSGSATMSVTVTAPNGCTDRDTIQVTAVANPSPFIGPDTSICQNIAFSLNAGPGYTSYSWSSGGNGQTIAIGASGTYAVTVTNNIGCQGVDSAAVTLLAAPSVNIGPDTTICIPDDAILNAGPGAAYAWSNGATTQTVTVSTAGQYHVTVTNPGGCTDRDTMTLSVNFPPQINLGPDTVVCRGTSLTLNPGGLGATYQWAHGPTTQSVTVSVAGAYAVTATSAQGCPVHDSIFITNFLPVSLTLPDTASICSGNAVTLDAGTAANGFVWSTGGTAQAITVSVPGTYSVAATDSNGCAAADTAVVIAGLLPTVNLGNDTSACAGGTVTLDAGNLGSTFLWNTGSTFQTIGVSTSGIYSVLVTNAQGCWQVDSVSFTVLPNPVANLGGDTTICEGASVLLGVMPGQGLVSWSDGSLGDSLVANQSGVYWVKVLAPTGCMTLDTMTLTVSPLPVPFLGADTTICQGLTVTLLPHALGTYAWSDGSTLDSLKVAVTGNYAVTVTAAGCAASDTVRVTVQPSPVVSAGPDITICPGDTTLIGGIANGAILWSTGANTDTILASAPGSYWIQAMDSMGCFGADTMVLSLSPALTATVSNLAPLYCATDPDVQLVGQPTGGAWSGAASGSGLFSPAGIGAGNAGVAYAVTDAYGCVWSASASTVVVAPPSQAVAGPDQSAPGVVTLAAQAPAVGTGHWDIGALQGVLSNPLDPHATLSTDAIGSFAVVWVVENAPCSPSNDTVWINFQGINIPTGFSPNGDAMNDTYVVRGIEAFPNSHLAVFNRWGAKVWESENYHNEWAGTNFQAEQLVDDTYYVVLEYGDHRASTYVVLKRSLEP